MSWPAMFLPPFRRRRRRRSTSAAGRRHHYLGDSKTCSLYGRDGLSLLRIDARSTTHNFASLIRIIFENKLVSTKWHKHFTTDV
jgi:hypothetical protein